MADSISALAVSPRRYHVRLEISARMANAALEAAEAQCDAVLKLLESAQILLEETDLGTHIDVEA